MLKSAVILLILWASLTNYSTASEETILDYGFMKFLDRIKSIYKEIDDKHFNLRWNRTINTNPAQSIYHVWRNSKTTELSLKQFDVSALKSDVALRGADFVSKETSFGFENDFLVVISEATFYDAFTLSMAKGCVSPTDTNCSTPLMPDIHRLLQHSNDAQEISFLSKALKTFGMVDISSSYIRRPVNQVLNKTAMWYYKYEDPNLFAEFDKVIQQIEYFYSKLFAYIRFNLREKYGDKEIKEYGYIPEHFIDQIVIQSWFNDMTLDLPYPAEGLANWTKMFEDANRTETDLIKIASAYMSSLGLGRLPENFLSHHINESTFEKVDTCIGSTYAFSEDDVRVLYCPGVNYKNLMNMFRLMTDYYYKKSVYPLPHILNEEACPGFGNGIAKAIQLSVLATRVDEKDANYQKRTINKLYTEAIQSVLRLKRNYVFEKLWTNSIERDTPKLDNASNYRFLMEHILGVTPVNISESDYLPYDFSGFLFVPYFTLRFSVYWAFKPRSLFEEIFGYQLYEALCYKFKNHRRGKNLHECNFEGIPEIGQLLRRVMSFGRTKNWREVMERLIGRRHLDGNALLAYFDPLIQWLDKEISEKNIPISIKRD